MGLAKCLVIFLLTAGISRGSPLKSHRGPRAAVPPQLRFVGIHEKTEDYQKIHNQVKSWTPDDEANVWELSGLWEGDIMVRPNRDPKNGMIEETRRWPGGVVPYYIKEEDFDEVDIAKIKAAMEEFHQKSCLRFRPYEESDVDHVVIEGTRPGCASSHVGRKEKGQLINLMSPNCLRHGTIVHELMHTVGFQHQQNTFNRDDYVRIIWKNVQEGKEDQFKKYDKDTVTDFGVGYDYGSIMHYSRVSFSSNKKPTIVPLTPGVQIGQRKGMSEKDVKKLQAMYKDECSSADESTSQSSMQPRS